MTRTQIQFPDPLYKRLKEIAEQQDWSLSEVMRKAAEHFVTRFPEDPKPSAAWRFPTLDCGGDFLTDPASLRPEADAILQRSGS
ncbi:MAG: ribbon-helix-helix protein, CopG family [Verrucomicrobiales bacterium]